MSNTSFVIWQEGDKHFRTLYKWKNEAAEKLAAALAAEGFKAVLSSHAPKGTEEWGPGCRATKVFVAMGN